MINKRRLIKTFKDLIKIDSPSLYEGEIIRHLKNELRALGIQSRIAGELQGGETGSLVACVKACCCRKPLILLNAHVDTVAPGEKINPLEKKGYLLTDGSTILGADNKAGVAAILEVLKVLKERKLPHPPLRIVFTVAEEIGLLGAKALPEKHLRADFGLTLDGGDIDRVITRAPSQYKLKANITGRAAHAGLHPEEGINAIKVASQAIVSMKLGRIDKETTANIGVIEGGIATNIIPEKVELEGEARSHNLKKLNRQVAQMERALMKACEKNRARLKLKVERVYEAFSISKENEIVKKTVSILEAEGIKPGIVQTGGGSDANIFNAKGIPTIILGVGADRVHTGGERICIKEFIQGTTNILNILRSFV